MISPYRIEERKRAWRRAGVLTALLTAAVVCDHARAADMSDDDILRGSFFADPSPGYVRWDGLQAGATVGYTNFNADFGNATSDLVAYILRSSTLESEAAPSGWTTLPKGTTNSPQFGAFIGYNFQWSDVVVGFDLGYNRPASLEASASDSISRYVTTSDSVTHNVNVSSSASLKLIDYATFRTRAGYAFGQFLPYAMIGAAVGRFNYSTNATVTDYQTPAPPPPSPNPGSQSASDSKNNVFAAGFVAGLGLDIAILPNAFVRAEWEYVAFAPVSGIRTWLNTGRVGAGVRF
jgi:outer membrane immunogenic protein